LERKTPSRRVSGRAWRNNLLNSEIGKLNYITKLIGGLWAMKKGLWLVAAVFVAWILVMPALAAAESVKIGVIDMKKIMRESKAAKKAQSDFMTDREAKRAILADKEKKIRELEQQIKNAGAEITTEIRQRQVYQLTKEVRELKFLTAEMDEELKIMDHEMTQKIMGDVMKVVRDYVKKGGYGIILERSNVLDMDQSVDITDTIIKLYDKKK
jgi:outer membrane protein